MAGDNLYIQEILPERRRNVTPINSVTKTKTNKQIPAVPIYPYCTRLIHPTKGKGIGRKCNLRANFVSRKLMAYGEVVCTSSQKELDIPK